MRGDEDVGLELAVPAVAKRETPNASTDSSPRSPDCTCAGNLARVEDPLRFLEIVRRELGADDARFEIGGREPGEDVVWCAMEPRRLVLTYDGALPESVAALRERLRTFVRAFPTTLEPRESQRPRRSLDPQRALDDALEILAQQSGAARAFVIDEGSPVLWGSSEPERGPEDVDDARLAAEGAALASAMGLDLAPHLAGESREALPEELLRVVSQVREAAKDHARSATEWRHALRSFVAITALRESVHRDPNATRLVVHEPDCALLARGFGGIYWMVLVFERAGFSELHAEAAMIHASPWIEKLVTALPPIDPGPGRGQVARLRRLRPV